MAQTPQELYLDLMKRVLSFSLWPEPPIPINAFLSSESTSLRKTVAKRMVLPAVTNVLRRMKLQLVRDPGYTQEARLEGRVWPGYADTMIGMKRLDNLQSCIETVIKEGIEGDLIETGVWRGGACIFMRAVLAAHGIENRTIFAADSFEGLPKPEADKWPADKGDHHYAYPFLAVSLETVQNNFRKYGLLDDKVVFLKGWFNETLPGAPIRKLALLRLDGDMYGSTMDVFTNLYAKLSQGGFCIIDDYHLGPCRRAVDDYRSQNGIGATIHRIDTNSVFWRKELA